MSHKKLSENVIQLIKVLPQNLSAKSINRKVSLWMAKYEDFVGLSEVKAAQARVLESEKKFAKSQDDRRDIQRQISMVQQKLHELHVELDRIPRGDDKYLALVTHEHSVIKEEKRLKEDFQQLEKEERENFAILSHTVRDSHEKERAQAEKTKYWSIIGSVLGTVFGVIGTTINNRLRMKELRDLVESTTKSNHMIANVEDLSKEISSTIQKSLNTSLNSIQVEVFSDAKWKQLQDSLAKLAIDCDNQEKLISTLNQQLAASPFPLTSTSIDNNNTEAWNSAGNSYFAVNSLKALLDDQTQHSNRLLALTCIIVPSLTWALVKFVNL